MSDPPQNLPDNAPVVKGVGFKHYVIHAVWERMRCTTLLTTSCAVATCPMQQRLHQPLCSADHETGTRPERFLPDSRTEVKVGGHSNEQYTTGTGRGKEASNRKSEGASGSGRGC